MCIRLNFHPNDEMCGQNKVKEGGQILLLSNILLLSLYSYFFVQCIYYPINQFSHKVRDSYLNC